MARWLLLFLLTTAPTAACVCSGQPSAKDDWQNSPLVLLGRVERIEPDYSFNKRLSDFGAQTAWVRVEEAFKGVKPNQSLVLNQENNDCSPKFKPGERVVLYLHAAKQADTWVAYGCGRTRSIKHANDDLRFLRALPRSAEGTRLSGTFALYEQSAAEGFRKTKNLPGLPVTIKGESREVKTATDVDGFFEVYGLAPGKYTIDVSIPPGLKQFFSTISRVINLGEIPQPFPIQLGPTSGVSVDMVFKMDNRMSGRVVSPKGEPIENVCLNAEPVGIVESQYFHVEDCTRQDGRYTLKDMPPGQYRIVANRGRQVTARVPIPATYYPGVPDRAAATIVTIGEGEHLTLADLRTPQPAQTIVLSGKLRFNDDELIRGRPITFIAADTAYSEQTETEADGTFSLKILAGRPGTLFGAITVSRTAHEKCAQFGSVINASGVPLRLKTPVWAISGNTSQSEILLTFPFPSCDDWP